MNDLSRFPLDLILIEFQEQHREIEIGSVLRFPFQVQGKRYLKISLQLKICSPKLWAYHEELEPLG